VFSSRGLAELSASSPLALLRLPFYVVLFAALLASTTLPLLLLARCLIRRRLVLTLLGMMLCPAPIVASMIVDGQRSMTGVIACLRDVWVFPLSGLPFVAGAITLGWLLSSKARS
jgi:hypothetical protein